jgi:hypothetical protein
LAYCEISKEILHKFSHIGLLEEYSRYLSFSIPLDKKHSGRDNFLFTGNPGRGYHPPLSATDMKPRRTKYCTPPPPSPRQTVTLQMISYPKGNPGRLLSPGLKTRVVCMIDIYATHSCHLPMGFH